MTRGEAIHLLAAFESTSVPPNTTGEGERVDSTVRAPTRFLIVLMGSIGDVVRGLYLVDAIKAAVSGAHITWVVEPTCAGIVSLHPGVDEVVVFQRKKPLTGVITLARELRQRRFDVCFDLQRHGKSGFFSWLSRAPRRIGFHPKDSKEGNWLFNTEYVAERGEQVSKVEHYQLFLDSAGIPRSSELSSGLQRVQFERDPEWKGALQAPYVGLVLGSSWDSKDWPEEGYRALIDELVAQGQERVVLLGDGSKVAMARRLSESTARREAIVDLVGRTSLRELIVVLREARMCIGPDSGPAHICGAVGTPHITLFGPTPVVRNVPQGSEAFTVSSNVGCAPCKRRACPGLGKVCMKLLSPQAILQHVATIRAERA